MLFEVEMPASGPAEDETHSEDGSESEPKPKKCSECPRILRSKKAIAAGVGAGCAARVGREIIASRLSRQAVRRQQTSDAA